MTQDEMRLALLDSTVRIIAKDGLDKATTRSIAQAAQLNEAYIYRFFNDKEYLFKEAFTMLDNELISKILLHLPIMSANELDFETRCRALFFACWKFILSNQEKCLCFIRYYFSPYFKKYSFDAHQARYKKVVEIMTPAFRPKANVWMLLNHILNTMLNFATKVFNGAVKDCDDTTEHVFLLVYYSIKPYLKNSQQEV